MNNNIKVSVIIPMYNLEKYIKRCLMSIIKQTLNEIEIIVVDDGSKDESKKVIEDIMANDKRIKYLRQPNMGVSSARNTGLLSSIGEYVTFVDGDDYLQEDMLEAMYNYAVNNELNIVMCGLSSVVSNYKENTPYFLSAELYIKEILLGNVPRTSCGILFNNKFIGGRLKFNIQMKYGEDMLFTISLLLLETKNVGIIPINYYMVEERLNSASRNENINQYIHGELLTKNIYGTFINANVLSVYEASIKEFCYDDLLHSLSCVHKANEPISEKVAVFNKIKKTKYLQDTLCWSIKKSKSKSSRIKSILIIVLPSRLLLMTYKIKSMIGSY